MPAGITSTNTLANQDLLIREVGPEIGLVDPDEAPLITLLSRMEDGPTTAQTKYEYFEDDFNAQFVTTTAAIIASGVTAIPLVDSSPVKVNDMLVIPAAANSANPPERIRVTAVDRGTHTLTVVRAVGGVGAMAIPTSTSLRKMAGAYGEGSGLPESIRTNPIRIQNFTQIVKGVVDWTRTATTVKTYALPSGPMDYDHMKMLVELKRDLNQSALFGVPSENLTGSVDGLPLRTTGGLLSRITTNKFDMGGNVTFNSFMTASAAAFDKGKTTKLLLCNSVLFQAFHAWGMKKVLQMRTDNYLGVRITTVQCPEGTFLCVRDKSLNNNGSSGFGHMAIAVDLPQVKRRVLAGNGKNADIKIFRDVLKDGRDRQVDYAMGELGWEIKQERYHSLMYNITGFTDLT